MSAYLTIYIKDVRKDNYMFMDAYGGYYRDIFQSELGDNVHINKNNNPLAKLVSTNDINRIIQHIDKDIDKDLGNISNAKDHIEIILRMTDQSINNRLEAIQEEEAFIAECRDNIKIYQRVKNFYTVLLDLSDENRIYAGIDCFAPDGSDVEE